MTTELTPQQTFEENIKARIRDDVGKLLPDEVLSKLMEKAMDDMFFKKRYEKSNGWGSPRELPSWFEEHVESMTKDALEKHMQEYMQENKEKIGAIVIDCLQNGLPKMIGAYFSSVLAKGVEDAASAQSWNLINDLQTRLRSAGIAE